MKGCPYDNAGAQAMFKVSKTEFANGAHFSSHEQLALELDDFVHWFNNIRIHGKLGYLTPVEFKQQTLQILSSLVLTYQPNKRKEVSHRPTSKLSTHTYLSI
jgi:transposase InsO family protein